MAYRDFAKRHPTLGAWVIPFLSAALVFAGLLPFVPWGFALLAGVITSAIITHQTY
jgi:hypothetical protein